MSNLTRDGLTDAQDLPTERQERLAGILDQYLQSIEQGTPATPERLLAEHPEDAPYLEGYLSSLKLFHRAADGLRENDPSDGVVALLRTGQSIGDYRLVREIGRGGMGVVYEAEQLSLKRRVALKVLPFVAQADEKRLIRFRTESQTAASIEHPHIVPVFAIGEEQGLHFYAMQLVDGRSIGDLIDGLHSVGSREATNIDGPMHDRIPDVAAGDRRARGNAIRARPDEQPDAASVRLYGGRRFREHVETVAELGAQAAEALHAAHEYGVVHRDIKPSNLLIDRGQKLWVTDFGLARCREGNDLTQSGDILGTLRYMSPEQSGGTQALVDHRTDIFSLGVTLYEYCCLRHPLDGKTEGSRLGVGTPIPPLRQWDKRVPRDLETILFKAMSESPNERYASAAEMAADLRRFLADEAIEAKRPSLVTRAGKWAKKRRYAVVASLAVLLVALGAALTVEAMYNQKYQSLYRRSQESLRQTRSVLDRFGSGMAEQLSAVPGAERVRLQLLQESIDYYHKLAAQASGDPSLWEDVALAYSKLGELHATLGDHQQSLGFHRRALTYLEASAGKTGDPWAVVQSQSICRNNIAKLLLTMGQEEEALRQAEAALLAQERMLADTPSNEKLLADAAATHTTLGLVQRRRQETDLASTAFTAAIRLLERQNEVSPSGDSLRSLAVGYGNLASVYEHADPVAAKGYHGRAIAIQKRLVRGQPLNLVYQRDLARSYNNLGYLAARHEHWGEAEPVYQDAIAIQTHLVKAAPAVAAYRRELALSRNNLAMVLARVGQSQEAEDLFALASDTQEQLLEHNPDDVPALAALAGISNNLGVIHKERGSRDQAERAFRRAVVLQQRAHELAPESQPIRSMLGNQLQNLAECLLSQGEFDEAMSTLEARRHLCEGEPNCLLSVAKGFLQCHEAIEAENAVVVGAPAVDRALETLHNAVACGLDKERLAETAFAVLADRPAFASLLAEGAPPADRSPVETKSQ